MILQSFRHVHHLPRDWTPGEVTPSAAISSRVSVAFDIASGTSAAALLSERPRNGSFRTASGLTWAARRELLDRHGFYDTGVIGGGDRAMAAGIYGCHDLVVSFQGMNKRQRERYLAWAGPFSQTAGTAAGWMAGDIYHLWHGTMHDRAGVHRHRILTRFEFDPFEDIAIEEDSGCWRWNSTNLRCTPVCDSIFPPATKTDSGIVDRHEESCIGSKAYGLGFWERASRLRPGAGADGMAVTGTAAVLPGSAAGQAFAACPQDHEVLQGQARFRSQLRREHSQVLGPDSDRHPHGGGEAARAREQKDAARERAGDRGTNVGVHWGPLCLQEERRGFHRSRGTHRTHVPLVGGRRDEVVRTDRLRQKQEGPAAGRSHHPRVAFEPSKRHQAFHHGASRYRHAPELARGAPAGLSGRIRPSSRSWR